MVLDSSSLSLLPTTANQSSADLLGILYGKSTGAGSTNPVLALQLALKTETKSVATVAKEPETARDIATFRAAVAKAKTPAELLANPVARKVLLTANGLGDQTDYGALVSKALLSDTSKTGSLASKLTDTRWLSVAKTYDFANQGLTTLQKPGVLDSLANGYAEVKWRQSLDAATPGLSYALDFRSRAGTITSVDEGTSADLKGIALLGIALLCYALAANIARWTQILGLGQTTPHTQATLRRRLRAHLRGGDAPGRGGQRGAHRPGGRRHGGEGRRAGRAGPATRPRRRGPRAAGQ